MDTIASADRDDTSFLHEAAIAHHLDSVLVANRVLLINPPGDAGRICFAQGIPPATSQAAAAFTSDQDVVRQMLHAAGLPVPPGRTLRFTDDESAIVDEASELGYPLIMRAAWGGRQATHSMLALAVPGPAQLVPALGALRAAAGPRSARPTQPRGRFMLERPVADRHLRTLVVGGTPHAAAYETLGLGDEAGVVPVSPEDLHPQVRDLLVRAAEVVPDIEAASVRMVLDDVGAPLTRQRHAVTAVDVHPGLSSYDPTGSGAGRALADHLLSRRAELSGVVLSTPSDEVSVELCVDGLPAVERAGAALAGALESLDLTGSVEVSGAADQLLATLRGRPPRLADLCDLLMEGHLADVRPLWCELRHGGPVD